MFYKFEGGRKGGRGDREQAGERYGESNNLTPTHAPTQSLLWLVCNIRAGFTILMRILEITIDYAS